MNLEGCGKVEYVISRAYDVCRLTEEDWLKLQVKEKNVGRGLLPSEIQEIFALPLIKEAYQIPENESGQSSHNQRLRSEFRNAGILPRDGDLSVTDLQGLHKFDVLARIASDDLRVNLTYSGAKAKRRVTDDLE